MYDVCIQDYMHFVEIRLWDVLQRISWKDGVSTKEFLGDYMSSDCVKTQSEENVDNWGT